MHLRGLEKSAYLGIRFCPPAELEESACFRIGTASAYQS